MIVFNGQLIFRADDGTHGQMHHELWVSDGTAAGMAMVKDINAVASNPVRVPSDLAHTLALVTAPPPHPSAHPLRCRTV